MTKYILSASAALLAIPSMASAQALPAPVIAVVDVQQATTTCNACRTALTQLEGQANGIRNLQRTLQASLQSEAASIQAAVNALAGRQPDAALTARATAFERKQQDAQRQLQSREQAFQRNRAFVLQQIGQKFEPAVASVQTRRGATIVLDAANVVRFAPSIEVTNDVIAALNASLTTISTTAPAQAQPAAPTGR
ncbi:MAG TPA: OmpH family outer membrane protein [Sphingomicrobium sp.]|nr:OmpH family outer membrane protein [Sphingomicrobium sp.]